jgi:hypothetical protein
MGSRFADCTYKEFIGFCAQRGLKDVDRTRWVDLFERAAGAAGRRLDSQEEAKLTAFIAEAREVFADPIGQRIPRARLLAGPPSSVSPARPRCDLS